MVGGSWNFKLVHKFNNDGKDGCNPYAGLLLDDAGNLYGTTYFGGAGGGTVFQLRPNLDGSWAEKLLHKFKGMPDGTLPRAGVIFDAAGNLYGTTVAGGNADVGAVFELMPGAGGSWTEKILHKFQNNGEDGDGPFAGVILDAGGDLYGTTFAGGAHNGGTAFEIIPKP